MNNPLHAGESAELYAHQQIDRCCDDFESQWRAGKRPRIDDFLPGAEPGWRHALLGELLLLEWELRRDSAESFGLDEYVSRFGEACALVETVWRQLLIRLPNERPLIQGLGEETCTRHPDAHSRAGIQTLIWLTKFRR